ncbi:dihydroorotase [Piscirickettsia litoralis]|uniref:Dihydroorotase n=1 Tax=Piscirickettsia litoralis TaxID=1891921 RepID=A0ABX3A0C2_9GAMM|nr:dihydroorotase [Piscirickettsia litoralis]ODN42287.1 dihydroorotase [Piscirickettsia litoralis]
MTTILITNATIINEGKATEADLFIKNGRIDQIGSDLNHKPAKQIIDAKDKLLIPGMIDDQVHFREPGLTHKGEMRTESRAAAAGGITSVMEMPNVSPPTTTLAALRAKFDHAANRFSTNYSFYLGTTNDNLDQIKQLNPNEACGVKVFMGASTGNMLVDDPKILDELFKVCPTLLATHCENTPMILANEQKYREQFGDDVPMGCHPAIRSEEACYASSSLAVELAKRHDTRLHVLHLTTAKELELFTKGDHNKKRITAEACVHHLFFNDDDYDTLGALIKCNPAIKTENDRLGILNAISEDLIDVIATDHAPHTWQEKQNSYFNAPSGLPLVQHALLSLLEHQQRGLFPIETIVKKTSHAVADIYQIKERGYIREGYHADIVLIDPNSPYEVSTDNILYKCAWSPFNGYKFNNTIMSTIINGKLVYHHGDFYEENIGKPLEFNR